MTVFKKLFGKPKPPESIEQPKKPTCPYCGFVFDVAPTQRRKCPACQKVFYVRGGQLVTKERAAELSAEYAAKAPERESAAWVTHVRRNGISEAQFDERRAEFKRRNGVDQSFRDTVWSLLNEKLTQLMQKSDWHAMKMAYLTMAEIRMDAGEEFQSLLRQAAECELRDYKQSQVVTNVKILTAGNSACDACKQQEGVIYTIEDAIKQAPIPHPACTTTLSNLPGWCRCTYLAIVDD